MYAELRPYGAGSAHPRRRPVGSQPSQTNWQSVERDLLTVTTRVSALAREPSIRTLPDGGLDGEHERWAADRLARQQAPPGKRRSAAQHRATADRAAPSEPEHSRPRWGIGR